MKATTLRRLGGALLLKQFGELWWALAVTCWIFVAIHGWYGWPVFMEHFAQPAPGTAPRYTGTIRVENGRRCSPRGCLPPRSWIRTSEGEMEFHCGYRPGPQECWITTFFKPEPGSVYVIGYDPYWGVDYMKYPASVAFKDDRYEPAQVRMWRVHYLRRHRSDAVIFLLTLTTYVCLVVSAFKRG